MLSRLKKRASFLKLSQKGRKIRLNNFTVLFLPHFELDDTEHPSTFPRIGLTASKRVGNAVCRNKAKRRLRVLTNEFIEPSSSFDFVFIAHHSIIDAPFVDLKNDFKKALSKVAL